MSTQAALELSNHLATTRPEPGQSYDAYMNDAFARWPGLSSNEIDWAVERAASTCRRESDRLHAEADALRQTVKERR